MKYLVNISGGSGSTVALARCIERYGRDNVFAVFADTNSEHPTLYSLLDEIETVLKVPIVRLNDGRDVWDVFFASRCIKVKSGGCKAAVELKHKPLDKYRDDNFKPADCTLVLGMDWMEPDRMARAVRRLAPWNVEFPLCWPKRLSKCQEIAELTALGLTIPVLYTRGQLHNNCAGACVLAGQAQWIGLLQDDPVRFDHYATKEAEWRKATGNDTEEKHFSILRDRRGGGTADLPLTELKARYLAGEGFGEWRSICDCMGYAQQEVDWDSMAGETT